MENNLEKKVDELVEKKQKKSFWKILFKVLKPQKLIIILLLLITNSYAWFIYSTKVEGSISAHVKSWDVIFQNGVDTQASYFTASIDDLYPGMDDYNYNLKIYNHGEIDARLTYELLSINILDREYISVQGRADKKEPANSNDLSSDELQEYLLNNFPFKIHLSLSDEDLQADLGESDFNLDVTWPFESGNDDLDTYWGKEAATFIKQHPEEPCIKLKVKVITFQAN